MNVYILTECYNPDDHEIIKVFETEQMARDYVHKRYNIDRYAEDLPHIDNAVVYYWMKDEDDPDVLIQRYGVQHKKI